MLLGGTKHCRIVGVLTFALCVGWAAVGLAFRLTIYGSMPIAEGEPYGEADVLELLHYGAPLILSALALLQGIILLLRSQLALRRLSVLRLMLGQAQPFVYRPVHSWVSTLAFR